MTTRMGIKRKGLEQKKKSQRLTRQVLAIQDYASIREKLNPKNALFNKEKVARLFESMSSSARSYLYEFLLISTEPL